MALIFDEESSDAALRAWQAESTRHLAWHWMLVETHASLVRREATEFQMGNWRGVVNRFNWVDLPSGDFPVLNKRNTSWRLRSADAGHVFVFSELHKCDPALTLVSFDQEMCALARAQHWPLWEG